MRILIYGVNYAPELTGIGKYSGEMAAWLAEQGHEVRVVTAPPYYPEWKVDMAYANAYRKEVLDGVQVYRCPLYVPARPSGLKRISHLASFALSSFPVMLKQVFWKPDVVMVIEPPLFCAPAAWLTARLSRAKCWIHIQDFEVDAAFELGIVPFSWMRKTVSSIESWLMKRFDKVSTISHSMMQRLHDKGIANPVLFPNWADLLRIQFSTCGRKYFRDAWGVSDDTCLCLYSGNIAIKQGLEILLNVAVELPDVQFIVCGDGVNRQALQDESERRSLDNIMFLPLQPLEKLADMLSAADIHLVIQKKGAADLVMPSKLTNILAIGGLALVTAEADSELGELAGREYPCAYRCDPESSSVLVESIRTLYENEVLSQSIMLHAKKYAIKYIAKDQVLLEFEGVLINTIE